MQEDGVVLAGKNNIFMRLDSVMLEKYERCKKLFFGRLAIKLVSEIVLAIFIAFAILIVMNVRENRARITNENTMYRNVSIGVSEAYIDFLFGVPKVSIFEYYIFEDESFRLKNNFYVREDSVLRIVLNEQNKVVAYFVTITGSGRVIPLYVPYQDERIYLGRNTFSEIFSDQFSMGLNVAGAGSAYNYYAEIYNRARAGNFNCFFAAIVSYGFFDTNTHNMFEEAFDLNDIWSGTVQMSDTISEHRRRVIPNTFGVASPMYSGIIGVVPIYDFFENIVDILAR